MIEESVRPSALVRALAVGAVAATLTGCSQAEQVARSAAEDVARDAVAQATAGVDEAVSGAARDQAQRALDTTLDGVPGTCADLLALPAGTRDEQAVTVLRTFWLTELTTTEPPAATVDAFAAEVLARCDDARETEAAVVLREVWATGAYRP